MVNTDPVNVLCNRTSGLSMTEIIPTTAPYLALADQPADGEMIDNCGIVQIGWAANTGSSANTNNAGTGTYQKGLNIVTYTASDDAGNTGTCSFTITVNDNEDPTYTCPPSITLWTGSIGDQDDQDCGYTLSTLDNSLDPSNVMDNCPGPITVSCSVTLSGGAGTFVPGPNHPTSLAGATFQISPVIPGQAIFVVTWTITDAMGNADQCQHIVWARDQQQPDITCPASPQVRTTSQDGILGDCYYRASGIEFDPTSVSDNCAVSTVTNNFNGSSTLHNEDFPGGSTLVIWTVTDIAGITNTCQVEIIVNDDEVPVNLYCPNSVTLPNIAGDCNNTVAWIRPLENDWIDNCDLSSDLTITEAISDPGVQAAINNNSPYDQTIFFSNPQTSFPVGTTTIVYTATDLSNNSSTCSFTVTIQDIEAPSVICPADQILGMTCGQGQVQNYIPLVNLISDNCSDYTITQSPAAGANLAGIPGITPADGEMFDVTISVKDNKPLGLSTSCTFKVTLDEVSVPVPTIAGPNLAAAFSECNDITIAAPTALECGNTIYGIPSQGTLINVAPPVYQYGIGNYFIIWTYVGANGSVQQSQQITVLEDLTPPNALCKPVNVNLSATNPGSVTVNATAFNNGSTDNCSIVGYSYSVNGGTYSSSKMFGCDDEGVNNVSLEVLDFNGNKGYCNTTLTINDITPPTIVGGCPSNLSFNTSNNGGYDCSGLATIQVPGVTDNCAIQTYQLGLNGPNGMTVLDAIGNPTLSISLLKGLTQAIFTVTDEHGLMASCNFNITIVDNEKPIISCAASGSRNTSADGAGDCEYTIMGGEFDPISFDDNCPGSSIANSLTGTSTLAGVTLSTGTYPITWTVTDAVGLTETCTMVITIIDDEAPIINFCQANKTQNVTAGTCNALVTWAPTFGVGTGHVMDNCGVNTVIQSISDPDVVPVYPYNQNGPYPPFQINQALFPIGITTISYTVTDIHNNMSTCSFTIEVIDNIAPTVVCPPNQTMSTVCANGTVQDYLGLIQNVSDNCPGNLVYTQSPASGTPLSSVPGLTPADGESFTVTITVTDPNPLGLSGNCSFTVTLDDVNLPIPDQATLLKDSTDCNVLILSPPTANDCGNVLYGIPDKGNQISFIPPLYEFTAGLYTVIWTYVGTNGSVQQTQQLIVQNDLVPPVMDCNDITINLDANGEASITPAQIDGGSKDNCGIATLSLDQSDFTCSDVGNNTITLTAVDIHGNSNWCTANVLVKDITPPTFNISNSTITVNCQSIPQIPSVLTNDACGVSSNILTETTTKGINPGSCNYYTYTITRKWTATDVNNNTSTVQQVINVQDVTAPVWTTAMPDTIYGVTNQFDCQGQILLVVDAFKVTDNCADFSHLTISYTGTNGSSGSKIASGLYPIGETTLTFIAEDPCGNDAVKDVVIIIEDKTPPTAVCVNSITLPLNPQGNLIIPPFIVDNGSYDNCLTPFSTNHVSLAVMPDTFDCDDAGKTFTITLTVTDLAGNTASCPATLTVIDNTIPTLISCAPDVTINCQGTLDPLTLGFPIVSDACGTTFNFTDTKVSVGGTICYNILRNWSIIDGSGNNLNCVQTISVTDNLAPSFTSALPQDVTIACGVPVPTPAILAATDNCGTPVTVSINETSTQTSNHTCTDYAYVVTRTWTATDECGNAAFHTQKVTVVDIQAPVIFGLPIDTVTLYTNDFNADSCTVPVTLVAQFIDCQDPGDITIVNDSPVGSGGISASGKYSADQLYTITFTATDKCGNQSQRIVHLRVIDNSIPNAYCIAQVNVALNSDGQAVITYVQIDDVSKDNCTIHPDLDFTLSKDTFDCKDLGDNIVLMTVTDEQGNSNTCASTVNVTADPALTINTTVTVTPETFMNANDGAINVAVSGGSGSFTYLWTPGNAVTPSISNLASGTYTLMITDVNTGCMKTLTVFVQIAGVPFDTISGKIITPLGKPVAKVHVNMTGSQSGTYYTGTDGYYQFIVPSGSTVTIRPFKDTLPANGVTALDFSIIQQHILAPPSLKPLTTPYQLIAADENGNNQINGIDIAQFNFTILNNKDTFPNVDSWVFVDSAFVFPFPTEPWASGWDDEITYAVISGNKPNSTFIAVKMGDVNGDVDVTKFTGEPTGSDTRGDDDLVFTFQDKILQAGEQIAVPVTAENFNQILAYQFAWGFDPAVLEFTGSTGNALSGLSTGNFGGQFLHMGLLTHLWAGTQPTDVAPSTVLFTMYFTVLQDGFQLSDVLGLRNSFMGELSYTYPQLINGVDLKIQPISTDPALPAAFTLLGNRPNPFSDQTLIAFTLPEKATVKLTVLDITGRPISGSSTGWNRWIEYDPCTPIRDRSTWFISLHPRNPMDPGTG
ncbi:MAG: HYR domain-containing protein [Saprospiraceae bacterium]|nr:HYR domain-containing protein [Saprospiraceae bacterium]